MAFDTTPGEHQIEMEYRPEIYKTAVLISLAGIGAFGAILAGEYVWNLIRRKYFLKEN